MRIRNALAIVPLLAVPALLAQACLSGTCEDASKECPSGPFRAADPNAKTGGNGAIGGGSGQSRLTTGGAGVGSEDSVGGSSNTGGGAGAFAKVCDTTKLPSEEPCLIDEMYGVFVSPLGNDGTGDGSRKKPFASIGKGIEGARTDHRRVYVCAPANALTKPVVIGREDKGLQLFGDFTCADGWVSNADTKTKITSDAAGALLISQSENIRIEGFEFGAADAVESGGSSYGAFVKGSTNVVLSHVKITAGKGKAGSDGVTWVEAAAKGADGKAGNAACSGVESGGASVPNTCAGVTSLGGKGGDGGVEAGDGGNAARGQLLGPSGAEAGKGQSGNALQCIVNQGLGNSGPSGDDGESRSGGLPGALAPTGFLPGDGSPGTAGTTGGGGGGGGGGGAKAPASCTGVALRSGASGGSGGAGGCGGSAGGEGKGGGGSFALVSTGSAITLDKVTLAASDGGAGGKGGQGQTGGVGGQPGAAATGASSLASCAGGMGGKGGNGGDGGGGAAGPSIGIAYTDSAPAEVAQTVAITVAASALGGPDASGAITGSGVGVAGISEARHQF